MKLLSIVLIVLMSITLGIVASAEITQSGAEDATNEAKEDEGVSRCPVTTMTKDCMSCHKMVVENGKPVFGLKEIEVDAHYDAKPYGTQIHFRAGEPVLFLLIESISVAANRMEEIYRYLLAHKEITTLSIEVHSPGGSVMSAWQIIGYFERIRNIGVIVETTCHGLAASAGGIILIGGDIGHRYVSKFAEIMIHKLWVFSMFEISDVDSAEDKAEMLKHFQKNINRFFEERTTLTREEIDRSTRHKMWWFNGDEAVQHGVADHLINK